ncbi:MAG TPA: tRNA uridine-5-carboxymethylaminomethyl(34) synthesis GTPase MnmE [Nevskiales bacterium]|nr:tRNA uridine-5-carboxymethylaminomethyl(34) synthesis GTPase MnmE [Nevskiales bacterium]
MPLPPTDTIAAIATPPGRGGIGILRISGPRAQDIARGFCRRVPPPRLATLAKFRDADGSALDTGLVLFFPAPHSYTGEDVLELQGHGGPVVQDLLLQRALALGARLARPGEFSERAFLNDRLDLAQAEAVADLIDAGSAQAARAALRSLQGEFSKQVHELVEALIRLRMHVEAAIDFPEEEIDFLSDDKIRKQLQAIEQRFADILRHAQQGALMREGMTVVLAGQPNVGKSSLLNRLAGYEAAIVTEIPGTTRDVLRERLSLDGLPLHVIDTAGLRDSTDPVEQEGVRRARAEIEKADRVLLLVDDRAGVTAAERAILDSLPPNLALTLVRNKCDLSGNPPGLAREDGQDVLRICALTGAGVDALREHLKQCMGYQPAEGEFIARRRHLDALDRANAALDRAREQLQRRAGELVAEELRQAQQALGEITGEVTSDALLGRIFASFCIGK